MNMKATPSDELVTGAQSQFLIHPGMRDAANYTNTKVLPATLFAIQSAYPVPWYNRNPIAQGVKAPGFWSGPKQAPIARQGNNQL